MISSAHSDRLPGSHSRIRVNNLEVMMSIGLHPWEKHPQRPQRVVVNATLYVQGGNYIFSTAAGGPIINYETICNHVRGWENRPHVEFIETLLTEFTSVCFADERVDACDISIAKPDIINDADSVEVALYLTREDFKKLS